MRNFSSDCCNHFKYQINTLSLYPFCLFITNLKILLRSNFGMPSGTTCVSHLFVSKFNLQLSKMALKNANLKSTHSKAANINEIVNSSGMISQASSVGVMTRSKTRALSQKEVQHTFATPNTSSLSKQDDETSSDNCIPQSSQK